jgi:hypothetical protein
MSGLPNPQAYDTGTAGVVLDRVTGLMWQRDIDPKSMTFADAKKACDGLELAGSTDWRLPSRIELTSIVDLTRSQPSINGAVFPRTPSDWFWTASLAADSPTAAWYVYFYFGYPKTDEMSNSFRVRCVRTATNSTVKPRYDLANDTVRDVATGLTWQRAVPSTTFTFEEARTHCADLDLAGQKGWRVPSMPEALTLVDEHTVTPCIDGTAFPGTPAESFWTSTPFADTTAMAWHVYFDHGNALYGLLKGSYRVRCVR